MSIILISLLDFESFPIRQLHALLDKNGHQVKSVFLKSMGYEFPNEKEMQLLIDFLKKEKPLFIAIGVRARYFELTCKITEIIKKNLEVPIAWGGIQATTEPEKCIKYTDILFQGESDEAILELAERMEKSHDYTDIKNLWVKKEGKVYKNPVRDLFVDLDKLPFTDFTDTNKIYIEKNKLSYKVEDINKSRIESRYCYPIMTSRGCLLSCTFCVNSFQKEMYKGKGKFTRRRSVKNVIEELKLAKNMFPTLNSITFGDDVFAFDLDWLQEFASEYKSNINLPFFVMFYPSMVDERSVKLLKQIGLVNVQMGIQSGSERLRNDYYQRFTSNEQIKNAMLLFKKYKLNVSCDLILGDVFENEKDREDSLKLLIKLPKPYLLSCFNMNYFPNYPLTKRALAERLITEEQIADNLPYNLQSFGKQFDENRPANLLFWESLYKLTTIKYFSSTLIMILSKIEYLKRHPAPLIRLAKTMLWLRIINRTTEYITKHINHPSFIYSKIKQKLSRGISLS